MIYDKFCIVVCVLLPLVPPLKGTRTVRQTYEGATCTLPDHPDNGQWRVVNGNAQPGDKVELNTILQFSCIDGYKIRGESSYIICTRDFDPNRLPECAKLCPPMYSTTTTTLKCVDKNNKEINCTEATDGSYMTYNCIPFYEPPIGYRKNILCLDGIWNYPKPVCQPVCGKKIDQSKIPLVFGGTVPKSIEYPWITAIFRKESGDFINVCGGTLISRRVVLTAAHCITDEYGNPVPMQDFVVGVGKYYNGYNEPKDDQAQYLEPLHIVTRSGYKGPIRNYIEDIGLIITRKLVKLSAVVQPVCISDINNIHLHVGYSGEIAGWGVKEDGLPSDTLRKLVIPYKDQTQCAQELNVHEDFADKYNMIDKMCAGFYNKNISVCKGDSGSGLVFKNPEDNRYYIHGIVSIGPANKGKCAIQQNTLYTRVSFYFDFIDRELTKNYIEDCHLPPYPTNGHWTLEFDMDKGPGDIVPSTTTLKITCKDGYRLSAQNSLMSCDSSFNMPTCDIQCSALNFPPESKVTCVNQRRKQIDCQWATDGSYVQYYCLDDDGKYGSKTVRQCVNGSWGSPAPTCPKRKPIIITIPSATPNATKSSSTFRTIDDAYRGPKVICTYASWWSYKGVDPEHLDPFLCTHMVYAFAGIWNYGDVRIQDDYLDLDKNQGKTKGLFRRLTDLKKINKNLKVLLSIGGTQVSNSSLFSEIAGNDGKIAPFIGSAMYFLKEYNFDGLNIAWDPTDVADKDKYLNFLSAVRDKLREKDYLLTASVGFIPENTGYDAKMISRLVDWVVIKTYDFYGFWDNRTGQNSALYPSSKESEWQKKHLNIHASVNNWLKAGLPRDKLVMTISFYGRTFALADSSKHGIHSPANGPGPGDGTLRLSEICQDYVNGYTEEWDDEQKNAYKYNDKYWFGYETKDSARMKGAYVKEKKLAGVNIWPVDGDDIHGKCGRKYNFLKHVHGGMGNTVDWAD